VEGLGWPHVHCLLHPTKQSAVQGGMSGQLATGENFSVYGLRSAVSGSQAEEMKVSVLSRTLCGSTFYLLDSRHGRNFATSPGVKESDRARSVLLETDTQVALRQLARLTQSQINRCVVKTCAGYSRVLLYRRCQVWFAG
jgi:hypothetical protein